MRRRPNAAELHAGVCVLGGGPAGAVAARQLAKLGHDVVLVERAAKREARAESLAPSILPILKSLGLRACAEQAAFLREERAMVDWEPGGPHIRTYGTEPPLLVDRRQFDRRLRQAAVDAGVMLVSPATAQAPRRLGMGHWAVSVATPRGSLVIKAGFLVDARGRRPGGAVRSVGGNPRTAALTSCWDAGAGAPAETRIEAGPDEWLWGNPLPNRHYAATVFLNPRRIAGLGAGHRADLYRTILSGSRLLGRLVRGRLIGPVQVRDATSRVADNLVEADFIRAGEAAFSIDPLSSQGIQAAVVSAIQAGAAVHTLLSNPDDPAPALEFYAERQRAAVDRSALTASRLYGLRAGKGASPFWQCRSTTGSAPAANVPPPVPSGATLPADLCLSAALRIVDLPVLSGALIKRMPALDHPGLARPVAYLGGVEVAPLASLAMQVFGRDRILALWENSIHPDTCREIMGWMYRLGLVVRQSPPPRRACSGARAS